MPSLPYLGFLWPECEIVIFGCSSYIDLCKFHYINTFLSLQWWTTCNGAWTINCVFNKVYVYIKSIFHIIWFASLYNTSIAHDFSLIKTNLCIMIQLWIMFRRNTHNSIVCTGKSTKIYRINIFTAQEQRLICSGFIRCQKSYYSQALLPR